MNGGGEINLMVKITKSKITNETAVYEYYPENEAEKYGIISVNRNNGEWKIEKFCEGYSDEYAFFASREVKKYIKQGVFKEIGYIAWY